jgi:hypothetical protein
MPSMKKLFILILLLSPPIFVSASDSSIAKTVKTENHSKAEDHPKADVVTRSEQEVRDEMLLWSRQLGVTCVYCHDLENFKNPAKETFKISLKHSEMVKVLQQEVFQDRDRGNKIKVKVECYMCHRGLERPEYREPPNNLTK